MRIGMWMGAPLRALGMAAVTALAACGGGGGGDDQPALEVSVKVDDVPDSAGPLSAGEASTVEVASGATLVFDSPGETRWEPTATDSSYEVNGFSFTSKSMTVSSNAGGTLVVVFTNKANPSEKATLNVTVAPKEFGHVAPVAGELSMWKSTLTLGNGTIEDMSYRTRTTLLDNGAYGLDMGGVDFPDTYYTRSLYDAQDGYLGWQPIDLAGGCLYDQAVIQFSFPMHVGKTWTGEATRTCASGATFTMDYSRTVEAFQKITVPAGTFDALRVKAAITYTNVTGLEGGTYTSTSTCWWAVDLGRRVKCDYVYHYPADVAPYMASRSLEELSSLSH
ncbi:hypothetical protein [Ideonella sp. YS5]|uniref:hypothetical protein n=1 Tax=Ideonella sp. YS5 TaxID=3453714 RepID=UPI003EE9B26A